MKLIVYILKLFVSTIRSIVSTMFVATLKLMVRGTGRNGLGLVRGRSAATDEASPHRTKPESDVSNAGKKCVERRKQVCRTPEKECRTPEKLYRTP